MPQHVKSAAARPSGICFPPCAMPWSSDAEVDVPLLARERGGGAEHRPRGARQVLRRGRGAGRHGRPGRDRCGHRGGRRGGGADARDGRLRAASRPRALRPALPGAVRRSRDEPVHRGRQADPRQPGRGDAPHRHLPHRRRGSAAHLRRGAPDGRVAARARLRRDVEARPDGSVLVHLAVQLPAQPGRAQDRARPRRRVPVRAQAGEPDPDRRAAHRRGPGRDGSAAWSVLDPALPARRRGAVHDRRASEAAELHRLARGGLGPEGARREEEGRARAGRQRRGRRRRDLDRPGRRGGTPDLRRLLSVGPELHRRAAHPGSRGGLRRAAGAADRGHAHAGDGRPEGASGPSSGR